MASNKQEWIDAFKHLRLHFSLLLMPVYLFALSQSSSISASKAFLTFIILHILVYPASNIFNSFYDTDQGSVGGLKNPPPANKKMLSLANLFDLLAISLSLLLGIEFLIVLLTYIIASRIYSYRPIRLKRYSIIGFLTIFTFQGAVTYYLASLGVFGLSEGIQKLSYICPTGVNIHQMTFALLATSFQIGAIYPLTQIYQHESDLADGVTTLSYKLGYRGTFIFAGIMFGIATLFYYLHFEQTDITSFYLFTIAQIPIIGYFVYWASKVWKNTKYADYKHTMYMNTIAALVLNLFFIYLVIT
jgi:1,4-dihydroxy-2-naphthoate octaprenyltransferase